MDSGWRSPLFWTILAVYLLAGVLYATLTPAWQSPDEPAHYNYVSYLTTKGKFPALVEGCYDQRYLQTLTSRRFPSELTIEPLCYEWHQPPLYYLLATPIFWASQGGLTVLRLLSVGLGGGVVVLAFVISRAIFPARPAIAYGTMAFVAFTPMHGAMLATVNNDGLAELVFAGLLLLLTQRLLADSPASRCSDVGVGVLLGLSLLTKTTIYISVVLAAATLGAEKIRRRRSEAVQKWGELARRAAIIYGLALALALPWYIRNAGLYGNFDILGLARHDQVVVGQLRTTDFIAEVGRRAYLKEFLLTTFHSFWGQFGWMAVPMDERVYQLLLLLTLVATAGLVRFTICELRVTNYELWGQKSNLSQKSSLSRQQVLAMGLMALTIGLTALAYVGYNLSFVQFQGRYLFPALIPVGLFFTLGLAEVFSERWAWWLAVGLALLIIAIVLAGLQAGNLDKWAIFITGLVFILAAGRAWLHPRWSISAEWLLVVCYGGLALLTLVSPFWFIAPNLSP
jgi:hypothetical protein